MNTACFLLISIAYSCTIHSLQSSKKQQTSTFHKVMAPIIIQAQELADQHAQNKKSQKPLIAIAGCSAVGKSHFTRELAKALKARNINVAILKQDDWLQPEVVTYTHLHPQFDYRKLHEFLQQLKNGKEHIKKPVWDKSGLVSIKDEEMACFHDVDLILFDGTYTLCGPDTYDFCKYSTLRIFIYAPSETIKEWNWQREQLKGPKARSKEKFNADVVWDMKDYDNIILPSKKNAHFIIYKDANHTYATVEAKPLQAKL